MKENGPFNYTNAPEPIKGFVDSIVESTVMVLGEDYLSGVYLHGSLAMGGYYFPKSDLDILVTLKCGLPPELKKILAKELLKLSQQRPTVGDIEWTAILSASAKDFIHPLPYELHCGDNVWKSIDDNNYPYSSPAFDPDLAAHCMVTKRRGLKLYGPEIDDEFGEVPWDDFQSSVLEDFEWIINGESLFESPYYGILNICRVMQMMTCKDQRILSKEEGAAWALETLPASTHQVVQWALEAYRSGDSVSEEQRKTAGREWDRKALAEFRRFSLNWAKEVKKSIM